MYRLALALGYTVADLTEHLGPGELARWQEFHKLEPFGQEWYRTALLCSLLVNFAGKSLKGKPTKPTDFMPEFHKPRANQQSAAAMRANFLAWAIMSGKLKPRDDD